MVYAHITLEGGKSTSFGTDGQWPDALKLLQIIQHDYQGARRQLEQISLQLAEKEALVNEHLQHAFPPSHSFTTLCLTGGQAGTIANQMGHTVLGEVVRPTQSQHSKKIEIRCLGRFEVSPAFSQDGCWHSSKAKSVFQYLLLRPRQPTVKEVLMEVLWPECTPQAAGNNLKTAIHSLRLILNQLLANRSNLQYVLFRQGSYLINPDINLWTDVEAFEKCWLSGRQLEKEQMIPEALREFEKAETLYRGDYLEDEPYEEWTLLRRETLKDIYLIVLNKLATYSMLVADYESCIHYSQKTLAKDEHRIDAYYLLMYCYAKLGQKHRALRWYEIYQQMNKVEFGDSPDNRIDTLYHKILKNEDFKGRAETESGGYFTSV